jgi:hypothetical protein
MNYLQKDFAFKQDKVLMTRKQAQEIYKQLIAERKRIDREIDELEELVA